MSGRLLLALLLLLQGCATYRSYPGPERAEAEIAIVEGYWHYYLVGARIVSFVSIDGEPIRGISGDITRIELAPGRRRIEVRLGSVWGEFGITARCFWESDFEKGQRYRIVSFDLGAAESEISLELQRGPDASAGPWRVSCRRVDG